VVLRAQPVVFGHRVFVTSESGEIYALDAKSGCTYWTYMAEAPIGATPSVAAYKKPGGGSGYAVYLGDRKTNVYALDVNSGALLWKRKADEHRVAGITGSPALYDGRLFVPIQGVGEESIGSTNNYPCCTFRGSVVAFDINTGEVAWKTYTVAESLPRGKTSSGVQLYGPSGGGIWSAPTIDPKRGALYVWEPATAIPTRCSRARMPSSHGPEDRRRSLDEAGSRSRQLGHGLRTEESEQSGVSQRARTRLRFFRVAHARARERPGSSDRSPEIGPGVCLRPR